MEVMKMISYKSVMAALCVMFACTAMAQNDRGLWISGSAVPDGVSRLERTPDGGYRYAGTLKEGVLRIMTTATESSRTRYLAPKHAEMSIVNKGAAAVVATDPAQAEWQVPFSEDRYRFYVTADGMTVSGELFVPWVEAYVGGGATDAGWNAFAVEPMKQSPDNEMVWTWTGELRPHDNIEEPESFKIMGLRNWGMRELHPFMQGEDPLSTTVVRTNGKDTKWSVVEPGTYRITVDVFKETFRAERLK